MVGIVLIQQSTTLKTGSGIGCPEPHRKLLREDYARIGFKTGREISVAEAMIQTKERISPGEPKFENSRVYA
jgi:hypothetical protein